MAEDTQMAEGSAKTDDTAMAEGSAVGANDAGLGTGEAAVPVPPAIVVHGDATPEQLAALVAVLSAASGGDGPASEDSSSTWAAHSAAMRHPVQHGPGAWRTSLRT